MRRYYQTITYLLSLILFVIYLSLVQQATAAGGQFSTSVGGAVGTTAINITGTVAPYASIVLTSDNVFLRSTVADAAGNFTFSGVIVGSSFSGFCLDAIDVKRLGESYTCFAVNDKTMNFTVFLPPTLGLQRDQVTIGNNLVAWGYTMPDATVTLHLSDGKVYTTTASDTGYYTFSIPVSTEGNYQVYADAVIGENHSSLPVKRESFTVVSAIQQKITQIKQTVFSLPKIVNHTAPLGMLWLAIPLIILIIILATRVFFYWEQRHVTRRNLEMDWYEKFCEKYKLT